ncbi:MAG TPA: carboxypeptidase regulatory-like domain-containing protein [Terriglobia bacterium]|nr:carboxypeptidase regulatory-like domain-containing protein [Terriglobia bacterium]
MRCWTLYKFSRSRRRRATLFLLLAGIICLAELPALGQAGRATITGTVTDPSGAVIPDTEVTVTNTLTGLTTKVKTTESGTYVAPLLQVGTYSLTFTHQGFQTFTQTNIVLTADQVATVNATLSVGQVTQTVEISANAEMIDTSTASLGQLISQQAVVDLPLNGRNPASLVLLSPGMIDVLITGAGVNQGYVANPNDTGASAAGGRQGSTYYMLDGSNSMDAENLLASPFPNPDATQEFQVIQNNFQAQYGFSPGAVVSIVTRSGTNQWHGNAFEFLRNSSLDATNFFTHRPDGLKRNQFGGSMGGPLRHDKLFIFGNYQRTQESINQQGGSAIVPNNKELNGDFSGLFTGTMVNLCGQGGPANLNFDTGQLFQPSQTAPFGTPVVCPAGSAKAGQTVNVKTPYPNNFIDPSTFNPVTMKFEAMLPKTDAPDGLVYFSGVPLKDNTNELTVRSDYNVSDRQRIFGRFFYNDYTQPGNPGDNPLASIRSWDVLYWNISGGHTFTISPTLVNNLNISYNRTLSESFAGFRDPNGKPFSLATLGSNVVYPPGYAPDIDQLSTNGFWFGQNTNAPMKRRNIAITDSVTWTKSRHMFVFGVDILHMNYQDSTNWQSSPRISFDGEVTGMPSADIPGNDRADYLLGYANFFEQGGGEFTQNYITNWAPYAQDTIRLKPNFTLNVGLRWEPYFPATPYYGKMASWQVGQQSTKYPNSPRGLVFPGDAGIPPSTIYPTLSNFDPRVGIAWQPGFLKNTSIRAAAGIFAEPISNMSYHHIADVAPFSSVFDLYYSQIGLISISDPWANFAGSGGVSPFPDQQPFANLPAAPPGTIQFILPTTVSAVFPKTFTNPKIFSWNFSVQHQFTPNTLLTLAYVGSEGEHLFNPIEMNPGVNNVRPYSAFGSILQTQSLSTSSYNSVQVSFNRRMSYGLQFTSNFTYSHCLDNGTLGDTAFTGSLGDPFHVSWNRGNCDTNIPLVWVSNWIWQAPKLASLGPVGSRVLGSWEFTGIWTAESGTPFSIGGGCNGSNNSGTLIGGDRADLTGQPFNVHQGSKAQWLQNYFNRAAFQCNAAGTFGNSARNLMAGPGQNNFDLGVFKNFPIKEHYNIQFRWEMFNAFNRVWFSNPNTCVTCGTSFSQITGQRNSPRIMQAALKFYW